MARAGHTNAVLSHRLDLLYRVRLENLKILVAQPRVAVDVECTKLLDERLDLPMPTTQRDTGTRAAIR